MDNFAFVIHPLNPKRDVARKYPLLAKILPTSLIHFLSRFWPPVYISHVTGVRSEVTGNEPALSGSTPLSLPNGIEGWLLACPFTTRQMLQVPPQVAYKKIVQTGRLAQRLGAHILGLGAFTSVVGDGGETIARNLDIPVTTGHSLTVALAVDALKEATSGRGIRLESATAAVVGATGSIGAACARLLAPMVKDLVLIGRRESCLTQVRAQVEAAGAHRVRTSTHVGEIIGVDVVLSATSSAKPIIQPQHLKRGAVICDVALPPDVSPRVTRERDDVLVIKGGVVDVPGEVDFDFNFGLPPGKAYACMAEAMVLALEGRYESYSLGKQVRAKRAREIAQLARKHGFRINSFRLS